VLSQQAQNIPLQQFEVIEHQADAVVMSYRNEQMDDSMTRLIRNVNESSIR